jgi:hypothetical protein
MKKAPNWTLLKVLHLKVSEQDHTNSYGLQN